MYLIYHGYVVSILHVSHSPGPQPPPATHYTDSSGKRFFRSESLKSDRLGGMNDMLWGAWQVREMPGRLGGCLTS